MKKKQHRHLWHSTKLPNLADDVAVQWTGNYINKHPVPYTLIRQKLAKKSRARVASSFSF
jgi:hypothetical protein